jgi:hypothetical protein
MLALSKGPNKSKYVPLSPEDGDSSRLRNFAFSSI